MSNDKVVKNIPFFFLFLLSFYPLMKSGMVSTITILFLLSTLIIYRANFNIRFQKLGLKPFLINCGFYILMLFSVLYSEDFSIGMKAMQASLIILFCPIIFIYFFPKLSNNSIYYIFAGFILSNFIVLCYFFNILIEGLEIDRFANLSNAGIVEQLKALNTYPYEFVLSKADKHLSVFYESHKVYLSLHFLIALILSAYLIVKFRTLYLVKVLLGILIIVFAVAIVYTQAVTSVLALIVVILIFPFLILKGYKRKAIYIVGIVVAFGLVWSNGFFKTYKNKNTASAVKLFEVFGNDDQLDSGIDKRFYIYKCSISLIKERMFFGHGVGNVQKRLNKCYDENNYVVAEFLSVGKDINSHNYYLNIFLATGIIGLIAFLIFLFHNARLALTTSNHFYLLFLVIMAISLLTENVLARMSGAYIFAIFNSLFYSISVAHVKR